MPACLLVADRKLNQLNVETLNCVQPKGVVEVLAVSILECLNSTGWRVPYASRSRTLQRVQQLQDTSRLSFPEPRCQFRCYFLRIKLQHAQLLFLK